jgi:hypothetical protein
MEMRAMAGARNSWKYFVGACILAAGLLFKLGVPVVPIAVGIAGAAYLNWKRLASRA